VIRKKAFDRVTQDYLLGIVLQVQGIYSQQLSCPFRGLRHDEPSGFA